MDARRLTERHGDLLLAGLLAVLFTVQIAGEQHFAGQRPATLAVALVFSGTLAWRRRLPLVPLVAGAALIEVSNLAVPELANTGTFLLGFLLASYSAGRYTSGRANSSCSATPHIEPMMLVKTETSLAASPLILRTTLTVA